MKTYFRSVAMLVMAIALLAACDEDKKGGAVVTQITIDEAADTDVLLAVKENETLRLTANVFPDNAAYKRVLFESADPAIFTVNQAGVITGEGFGKATLHIFAADGGGAFADYTVDVDYRAEVLHVKTPGSLAQLLTATAGTSVIIAGTLNAADMTALAAATRAKSLTDVDMSLVTAIPGNALEDALFDGTTLETIKLPASLRAIGQNTFRDCQALASVVLASATPPSVPEYAFDGLNLGDIALTVPPDATDAYRETDVWKMMIVNGIAPSSAVYIIPAAPVFEGWQVVQLNTPITTSQSWVLQATSTQPGTINQVTFGSANWGVQLFRFNYTGSFTNGFTGNNNDATEFYLGGTSQGGTKIGAVGRGNWNSTTHTLTPPAITLGTPLIITITCNGDKKLSCTIQNEGINGGQPLAFGTFDGDVTITAMRAATTVPTTVSIVMR
ncbi:MAG: leucine-rich repeat protein [Odoribacteraceae bacterium]|nr:leucine-rich repeat protein [Odoribacteraceae bacterium]